MPDIVHSRTLADIDLTTDHDTDMYLRIKYIGKKTECFSDPIKIRVLEPFPIVTLNCTELEPGNALVATGNAYDSMFSKGTHLSTEWVMSTDPERAKTVNIGQTTPDLTTLVLEDFWLRQTGDYYISTRYLSTEGYTKWSEPVKFHWERWDPDSNHRSEQSNAGREVKETAEQCRDKKTASWFTTADRYIEETLTFATFDSPLITRTLKFTVQGSKVTSTADSDIKLSGTAYGDTFTATISDFGDLENHQIGRVFSSAPLPNGRRFWILSTAGSMMTDFPTSQGDFHIAIYNNSSSKFVNGSTLYGSKVERTNKDRYNLRYTTLNYA